MSGRTARNMVAELPDGSEVSWRTQGQNHDYAGVVWRKNGGTDVVARGWSARAVAQRTYAAARREYPGVNKATVGNVARCLPVTEETAPVLREYFSTHRIAVTATFTDNGGWQGASLKAGRSDLRRMAREGITHVHVERQTLGVSGASRQGDFSVEELIKSMNARKGR